MPNVTFIGPEGNSTTIAAEVGFSVMEIARLNGIAGIIAECGGAASCATCHVYVDDAWLEIIPPKDLDEDAMLDFTVSERNVNSRLSCQIRLSEKLDGLVVKVPETQS